MEMEHWSWKALKCDQSSIQTLLICSSTIIYSLWVHPWSPFLPCLSSQRPCSTSLSSLMISLYILSANPHHALLLARLLLFMLRCLFSPLTVSVPELLLCSSWCVSPLSYLFDMSSQRTSISSLLLCPATESSCILVQSNGCELLGSRYSLPTVTMRRRFIVGKMLLVSCIFKGNSPC